MKRAEIRRIAFALLALACFGIGAGPLLRFAPRESINGFSKEIADPSTEGIGAVEVSCSGKAINPMAILFPKANTSGKPSGSMRKEKAYAVKTSTVPSTGLPATLSKRKENLAAVKKSPTALPEQPIIPYRRDYKSPAVKATPAPSLGRPAESSRRGENAAGVKTATSAFSGQPAMLSRHNEKLSTVKKSLKGEPISFGGPKLGGKCVLPDTPKTPVLEIESAEPRYWRAGSYDTFDGISAWTQRHGPIRHVDCSETLRESGPGSKRLDISARVLEGGSFTQLLAPLFQAKVCAGNTPVSFEMDSLEFSVPTPLPAGSRYTVSSIIEQYSLEDLRAASADYPPEVRERYLQLPQGTPSRIRELALTVTAGASNDFDRAKKIEAFLGRSGKYPYTLEPPPTPEGRNGVDYFLFDSKRGHCSYFSSAMAVLLRSIGIPSRVADGFAPGDWNALTHTVTLTMPTHAWVEVYFPGYGWLEFEPTSGGPAQPKRTSSGLATNSARMTPEEGKKPGQPSNSGHEENSPAADTGKKTTAVKPERKKQDSPPSSKREEKPPTAVTETKKSASPPAPKPEEKISDAVVETKKPVTPPAPKPEEKPPTAVAEMKKPVTPPAPKPEGEPAAESETKKSESLPNSQRDVKISANKSAGASNKGQEKSMKEALLLFMGSKLEGAQASSDTSKTSMLKISVRLGQVIGGLTSLRKPANSTRLMPPEMKLPSHLYGLKRDEKLPAVETATAARDLGLGRWQYAIAVFLAVVLAGCGARLYWALLKRARIGMPVSEGRHAVVQSVGTTDLDIRFPRIESDLPLYWGTGDPPIEIMVVKPEGVEVSLTVNGEERALPVEKGEYLLEIRHEGRSVVKVVNIIDYGEEIERDFREFIIQHGFKNDNLTARQLLDRIHKADPGFKRPEKALTLFENYAYGNKMIVREEYVRYYRSGRFGPAHAPL